MPPAAARKDNRARGALKNRFEFVEPGRSRGETPAVKKGRDAVRETEPVDAANHFPTVAAVAEESFRRGRSSGSFTVAVPILRTSGMWTRDYRQPGPVTC
jgi:hypothetical protein